MMTEEQLANGCREGDNAARKELYDRYSARLYALCLRYVGDRDTAGDLLHDAFLKIYGVIGKFAYRGNGSLRAWLERVTVNLALEWLKKRRNMGWVALDETLMKTVERVEEPSPEQMSSLSEETLLRYVAELPDGYRTVFNLFCIEGYSHREIAEMLGINEKSSSSQLARARAMLARKIIQNTKQL